MKKIEELMYELDECGISYTKIRTPEVYIDTPDGEFRITLDSVTSDTIDGLVARCNEYKHIWIYSLEHLAASGRMMLRFAWVN